MDKETYYIVDLLAHEYGWSVEYIQNLEIPEICGLIEAILDRQDTTDIRMQANIAKGFSGKVSSNRPKRTLKQLKNKQIVNKKKEVDNLKALAKMLNLPVKYETQMKENK